MATAADIARLRRMVDEPTTTTYSDAALTDILEAYPLTDERGVDPYYYDTTTDPPTQVAVVGWYPGYDLHAAAADIWEEKAGALAEKYDWSDDFGKTNRYSQQYDQYRKQARQHMARRKASSGRLLASPTRNRRGLSAVGNLAEEDI